VTEPRPEPEELEGALELEPVPVPVVVVVVAAPDVVVPEVLPELDALVVLVLAAELEALVCRARAGSCPVTSSSVISSHVATNSATALATTRRRIIRTRARRACLSEAPRSLGVGVDVMSVLGCSRSVASGVDQHRREA